MKGFRMVYTGTSYFGADARENILTEVMNRNFRKALLVTDPGIEACGISGKVREVLDAGKVPYATFSGIKPNPTIENVRDGLEAWEESQADFLIAVGGGSVIDTAEAVSILANNPENRDVVSLEGMDKNRRPGAPVIAVPTTAGTGSETTMDFVITNTAQKRKMACMSSTGIPVVAILDTELMAGMPPRMTAATGMDALTHAVESYLAKGANTFSELLSLKAVGLIADALPKVLKNPKDLKAREDMALAEYMAGMSFTNVGLGIVHSMAHPLSAFYDIPHGVANALILPFGLAFNAGACTRKMKELKKVLCPEAAEDERTAECCCEKIRKLNQMAGLPMRLRELNVKREDLDDLSRSAFEDVSTLDNPREVTQEDLRKLYESMF